jgi:digeranylgeranylglycerophospholipid reductase
VHDVIVIGAGPAGLVAARDLAARGHDVLVVEEHPEVGVPVHCTGLLGTAAFDELALPRHTILGTTHSARFVGADRTSVLIDAAQVSAAIVDRAAFDQALAETSRGAGAELQPGTSVRSIAVEPSRVVVTADDGHTLEARACVLACGASYRFNRTLGLGVPRKYVQSAQVEIPMRGPEQIEVHLGRHTAPGGFAWVVPFTRGERAFSRIGVMCDAGAASRFAAFADYLKERFGMCGEAWPEPRVRILPLGPVSKTYGDRLLAVGDAAGLVKPTTGGGIYYSLISGQLAAGVLDSALRADQLDESVLRAFETGWRDRLGTEIRIGLAFRGLAARLNDRAIDALVELARVDGIVPLLKQTADFNWHAGSALALLRHAQFRRILLGSLWS